MSLILKELFIEKIIVQILPLVFFCSFWVFVAQFLTYNISINRMDVVVTIQYRKWGCCIFRLIMNTAPPFQNHCSHSPKW